MRRGRQQIVRGEPPSSVPGLLAPPLTQAQRRQQLVIPIRPQVDAVLYVPFPMTSSDWEQFMAVLAAMKPGLVRDAPGPAGIPGEARDE